MVTGEFGGGWKVQYLQFWWWQLVAVHNHCAMDNRYAPKSSRGSGSLWRVASDILNNGYPECACQRGFPEGP